MSNKPFVSQNTNIFNENKYNTVPGTIGNDSVLITQSSQRRIIDQKSLTITKNETQPPLYYISANPTQQKPQQSAVLSGRKEYYPGGITYTFNPANPAQPNQLMNNQPALFNGTDVRSPPFQLPQPPLTLEQMIALNQLEKQGLELTLMQERLKQNPYQLTFHYDNVTSTSDLMDSLNQTPPSQGLPDFQCVCSARPGLKTILKPINQSNDSNCFSPGKKKLLLTKSPDLVKHASTITNDSAKSSIDQGSSCDDLSGDELETDKSSSDDSEDAEKSKEKKRKRASKKEKNPEIPSKKSKRTKSAKHRKQTSSEESIKRNKKRRCCKDHGTKRKRRIKTRNCTSDSSTDSEDCMSFS